MKKEKILKFINLLNQNRDLSLDTISIKNYQQVEYVLKNIDDFEFKDFNHIVKRSEEILKKMSKNYDSYKSNFLTFIKREKVSYQEIRKELFFYPSFDDDKGIEIKNQILKIKEKSSFYLKINSVKINLHFYGDINNNLVTNLSRIIYLFFITFGQNNNIYNNYNIRFLLIDFPRVLDSKVGKDRNSFQVLGEKGFYNNSSGVNIFSKKELVVTRKSGLNGLLIHELIHMFGLDFCYNFKDNDHINILNWEMQWVKSNNIILKDNNIRSFIEGICNTNSSYFLAIYNSIYLSKSILKDNKEEKYFKYFLYIEFLYCYINAAKLLKYFNFDSFDSVFNNNSNRIFYQNALVFEYVIMRMFLVSNYYKLLLKDIIKYNYNETNNKINTNLQYSLNNKLLKIVKSGELKEIFDKILFLIKDTNSKNMEYFCTNFN